MLGTTTIRPANLITAIEHIFPRIYEEKITGINMMLELARATGDGEIRLSELQAIIKSRPKHSLSRSIATQNFYKIIMEASFPIDQLASMKCADIFANELSLRNVDYPPKEDDMPVSSRFFRGKTEVKNLTLEKNELVLLAVLGQIDKLCIDNHHISGWVGDFDVFEITEKYDIKMTLTHWAILTQDYDSLKTLVHLKANLFLKYSRGETAYDMCIRLFDIEALTILLESEQLKRCYLMDPAFDEYRRSESPDNRIIKLLYERGYRLSAKYDAFAKELFRKIVGSTDADVPAPITEKVALAAPACGAGAPAPTTSDFTAQGVFNKPTEPAIPSAPVASPITESDIVYDNPGPL